MRQHCWTKISDVLPDLDKWCILIDKNGIYYVDILGVNEDGKPEWIFTGSECDDEIVAWMYVPEFVK